MIRRSFRFAEFELVPDAGELRTHNSVLRLQEKPLVLLTALVEHAQGVVTRDQLRQRMWGEDTFVDYEQGINVAVKKVRDALGDSAESPRFIQTVPRRGYRFLPAVEVVEWATACADPADEPARQPAGPEAPLREARRARYAALVAVVLTAFAVTALLLTLHAVDRRPTRFSSIAVLPLRDLSPDSGQEYLADGITEELITDLAQSLPLRVVSRTSIMHYKQTSKPVAQIARELGVEALVEGSVVRSGNRVAVTVQLIDATKDRHLWAQQYDRKAEDLLAMEAELSQEIARQVGGTLSPRHESQAANSRPVDPEVHQLYLKGRYFWNKRTAEGVRKAAEYFQQAVNLDPNYAMPYVGLADCYLFGEPPLSSQYLASKASEMAKKALEIDDNLGEAHATLGLLAENSKWDWAEAEREYKRAIELNPNYATTHQWYGEYLALTGRFEQALAEMKLANDLDPLSLVIIGDTGEIYYAARKYDRAIEYFRKTLEMDPGFVTAHRKLAMAYAQRGEFSSAITELQVARQLEDSPGVESELGYVYALSGRRQDARRTLGDLMLMSERRYVFPDNYAVIYAGLGDKDKALEWLNKAYLEGGLLTGLKVDPQWDNLRADARFTDLERRVGLAR